MIRPNTVFANYSINPSLHFIIKIRGVVSALKWRVFSPSIKTKGLIRNIVIDGYSDNPPYDFSVYNAWYNYQLLSQVYSLSTNPSARNTSITLAHHNPTLPLHQLIPSYHLFKCWHSECRMSRHRYERRKLNIIIMRQ